ncbi:uncharacterized protein LOC116290334 [Actinia tenebrosa]|uniref:Uncharacterized protein LOC116290334 n=1 Tax=Actinia tenebrosa TaxID=6105 RepID=A0A6P8HKR7_ACTTE|nr:uncharacterized protein LOC116290334 [Actinia tenebrosa]
MAPVLIKVVVRCSSQDLVNGKVENLLRSQVDPSAGRWTCSKHDTNQRLEAEFQLEKSSFINHVDIGNYGSAFVEVFVGNSMWPPGKEFISLLPSAMLMLPADCKQWRQTTSVRMFHEESFNKRALKEKWDCVRVICRQPYRKDKQFGLSFIRFGTKDEEVTSSKSPIKEESYSALNGSPFSTPKGKTFLSPRLKKSSIRGNSPDSPGELTWASKVLQAALDTKSKRPGIRPGSRSKDDSILDDDDDDDDNDDFKNHSNRKTLYKRPSSEDIEIFEWKKGRVLEPPDQNENSWIINEDIEDEARCFLDGIDFTKIDLNKVTYSDLRNKMEEQRGRKLSKYEKKTFLKIARDAVARVMEDEGNSNESETSHGSKKNNRCTQQVQEEERSQDHTVNRRSQPKKMTSSYNIDDDIFTDTKLSPRKEECSTTVSPTLKNNENRAPSETEQFTECPICGELFSSFVVEGHAASCMNFAQNSASDDGTDNSNSLVECPICSRQFSSENIMDHANYCAETTGRNEDPEAIIAL